MRLPSCLVWLSHAQAIAIMKVSGSTHVISQIATPIPSPAAALSFACATSVLSSVGGFRNPPKIRSVLMLRTQRRSGRRLVGLDGGGASRTSSRAAAACSGVGWTPRSESISAVVRGSDGSRP